MFSYPMQSPPQHSRVLLQPSLLELVIFRVSLETYPETTAVNEHEDLTPPEFRNEGTRGANSTNSHLLLDGKETEFPQLG